MAILDTPAERERVLREARRIVVLGATPTRHRAGFYVGEYLADQGYDVQGVNPAHVGTELFGKPVLGSLAEVEGAVDLLDVFRRSDALPGHLDEILALEPRVVWLQLGVVHNEVAAALSGAGMDVVQNRCTLADHRAFGLRSR